MNLHLYTTYDEIVKSGDVLNAWPKGYQPEGAIYHISVPFNQCSFKGNMVEVTREPKDNDCSPYDISDVGRWMMSG